MNGFIKYIRSDASKALECRPNENHLLNVIARRISRNGNPVKEVLKGEALIGDYKKMGLKRQPYRTALTNLQKWGYITIRATNKGTYAKLANIEVYDCNINEPNQQNNQEVTNGATNNQPTEQPTANHYQEIKNKEYKRIESFLVVANYFKEVTKKNIQIPENNYKILKSDKYKKIAARLKDGYSIEECKKVIDIKYNEWKDNPKMKKNIQISTFFAASNFEKYLDETLNQESQVSDNEPIDLLHYYKTRRKFDTNKIKYMDHKGLLAKLENKLNEVRFKCNNIAKAYSNQSVDTLLIFDICYGFLGNFLKTDDPDHRLTKFKSILSNQNDYIQNKGDILQLMVGLQAKTL